PIRPLPLYTTVPDAAARTGSPMLPVMLRPAPSPPPPASNPPTTLPFAGHCQVMPPALRVAPGGGVGTAGCAAGGGTVVGAAAVAAGTTDAAGAATVDSDSVGATPFPVMDCVLTGPNTGAEGCVVAGACVTGRGGTVAGAGAVLPATAGPVASTADVGFNFNTCPGWITYGGGMLLSAASWRTSMPCAKATLYMVSPRATV